MTKRKLLAVALSLAMILSTVGMAFGQVDAIADEQNFSDMPDNWSTAALNKAVENQLLMGYEEGGVKLIKADNSLTRAEMAAVVNRAFASEKTADIGKVTDVENWAWYAKDMAKAVKMGTFALDTKMRPGDKITRQEAFAVLARAFKLAGDDEDYKALDKFSDKAEIASWALKDLDGMAAAGYIQGSSGKLNPKANITRAEFAVVMDNLVKQYIDEAAEFTEVVTSGNVMVRVPGVTLKNLTVKGDLIVADGVGDGDFALDNVKVEGRTVVRGGGENSIIIKGNSDLGKIIVSKVDGKVRISVEGGAEVDIIYVDDGSDDVLVEGTLGVIEVAGDSITVTATNATIASGVISGDNSRIVVGTGSSVKEIAASGKSAGVTVKEGATVDKVTVSGSDTKVEGKGTVKDVDVKAGGDNASVTTPNTKTTVDKDVAGVKAGGKDVPAGATATNNASGTDATVTEPSTGGGGGGGSGVTSKLKIEIRDGENIFIQGLDIDNIKDKEFKATDLDGIINAIVDFAVDEITNVKITGIGTGIFAELSDFDSDNVKGLIDTIVGEIKNSNRDDRISNAIETSVNITAFSYTKKSAHEVKSVYISIPNKTEGYVWKEGDTDDFNGEITAIYDALANKKIGSFEGLKMTVEFTDNTSRTVELIYKNV